MHTWSFEYEKELRKTYSPVKDIIEPQIIFDFEYIVGDPNGPGGEINRWHDGKFRGLDNLRFHSMFSRWYSAKMANELKRQHEEKNNFKYDFVMLTRLDLAYLVDFDFSKFDKSKFYMVGPDHPGHGVHDLWFISNSDYMDLFAGNMYDFLKQIKHFPHKYTHSHFFARHFLIQSGLYNVKNFFGEPRYWDSGRATEEAGPSPCVRHHYNLREQTPDSDMAKAREYIKRISKITIEG
jgi:hypothetical protein